MGTQAQAPSATPAATPAEKPKQGYLRFWNMTPKGSPLLQIAQKGAPADAGPLATAEPLNYYASYDPLAPGRYDLTVYKGSDRTTPLEHFDLVVRRDVYVTFLATEVEGKTKVELLDDTYDPSQVTTGRLTLRNHFPDAKVSVSGSNQLQSRVLTNGETQVIDGFPLTSCLLQMRATLASGKVQQWSAEVDFRNSKRASLLVVPDPYGRFRPRVSADGPTATPVPAMPPGTAGLAPTRSTPVPSRVAAP